MSKGTKRAVGGAGVRDMESKHAISMARWNFRSSALLMAAAATIAAGPAHAGPMSATPTGGSVLRAWNIPYNPASPGMVTGLQKFIQTKIGGDLIAQLPSLGIIKGLSPDSEVHRRIIGSMALPAGFEGRLQTALRISDEKALSGALEIIRSAYQDAERSIDEAVQARAEEVAAALRQNKLNASELSAAASELAPFAPISAKAKAIGETATGSANVMDKATRIASVLMSGKSVSDSDDTQSRTGTHELAAQYGVQEGAIDPNSFARRHARLQPSHRRKQNMAETGIQKLEAGKGAESIAVGDYAEAYGGALADGNGSIAVGRNARALGSFAIAVGKGAAALGDDNIAIGDGAEARTAQGKGTGNIAIGPNAQNGQIFMDIDTALSRYAVGIPRGVLEKIKSKVEENPTYRVWLRHERFTGRRIHPIGPAGPAGPADLIRKIWKEIKTYFDLNAKAPVESRGERVIERKLQTVEPRERTEEDRKKEALILKIIVRMNLRRPAWYPGFSGRFSPDDLRDDGFAELRRLYGMSLAELEARARELDEAPVSDSKATTLRRP